MGAPDPHNASHQSALPARRAAAPKLKWELKQGTASHLGSELGPEPEPEPETRGTPKAQNATSPLAGGPPEDTVPRLGQGIRGREAGACTASRGAECRQGSPYPVAAAHEKGGTAGRPGIPANGGSLVPGTTWLSGAAR